MKGSIRGLVREDLPAIAALRRRAFGYSEWPTSAGLERVLHRVFFESPWRDERLGSLVYEREGRVAGFLGVVPRRFRWETRPITVASSTLFMVEPDDRSFAGMQLLARFFEGPQDLSLTDNANDASRPLWTRAGGEVAPLYGMAWRCAVRPFEITVDQTLGGVGLGLGRGFRPLARVLDAVVSRWGTPSFRRREQMSRGQVVTLEEFVRETAPFAARHAVSSEWDGAALEWVTDAVAGRRGLGDVRAVVVRDTDGAVAGCYLYGAGGRGLRPVIQFSARERDFDRVLDDLGHRVWQEGAAGVEGRADAGQIRLLGRRRDVQLHHGAWVLVHSRDRDLLDAFRQGSGSLSRLDGEWWMRF